MPRALRIGLRRPWPIVLVGCGRLGFDGAGDAGTRPDAPANAQTLTLPAAADTYLSADTLPFDERVNNFGGDDRLRVKLGEEHALVRFGLQQLPATASVFAADLVLTVEKFGSAVTIAVHPVKEAWNEGNLDGAPGTCNWTMRDAQAPWSTAGAAPPGSAMAQVTSFTVTSTGKVTVGLPASLIESWRDSPATNFGVLLLAAIDDDVDFYSREDLMPANRPLLVVTYVDP